MPESTKDTAAKKYAYPRVDNKLLTVKLSYNPASNRFFLDLWDIDEVTQEAKYLVSLNISEAEANGVSRETGIRILI
jgi:hypothetical protein